MASWSLKTWVILLVSFSTTCCQEPIGEPTTDSDGKKKFHVNATNILENILRGYEPFVRPGAHGMIGPPTKILVDVMIRSMGPISEVDMTYSMDLYFRQTWVDKRLMFTEGDQEMMAVQILLLERLWKPDTFFYNGHGSYLHTITTPNKLLRIMKNGTILYSMRLTIKANCPMYLQYFPMDQQSCPLQFGSYAYTKDMLYYEWKRGPLASIKTADDMRLSQFDLTEHPAWNITIRRNGGDYSTLKVNFKLERHMGYFLIQVYVPCTLIVILSWVSFWINREATADRVGLGITTVLTLTTLSMDTRDDLPKVSYATALDWYVITCFGFVIGTLLQFAGVHYFTKIGSGEVNHESESEEEYDDEEEEEEDEYLKQEMVKSQGNRISNHHVASAAFHNSYMTQLAVVAQQPPPVPKKSPHDPRQDGCFVRFLKCLQGSHSYRKLMKKSSQHSGVNSVSMIDKVSRIIFPLSFITFNVIYWIAYTR